VSHCHREFLKSAQIREEPKTNDTVLELRKYIGLTSHRSEVKFEPADRRKERSIPQS